MNISQHTAAMFNRVQEHAKKIQQFMPEYAITFTHTNGETQCQSPFHDGRMQHFSAHEQLELYTLGSQVSGMSELVAACQEHPLFSTFLTKDHQTIEFSFSNDARYINFRLGMLLINRPVRFFKRHDYLVRVIENLPTAAKPAPTQPLYVYCAPSHIIDGPYNLHPEDIKACATLFYREIDKHSFVCEPMQEKPKPKERFVLQMPGILLTPHIEDECVQNPSPNAQFYKMAFPLL